jgi:hypothetical protein
MGVWNRIQQLLDTRKRAARGYGASLYGFIGAVEVIPREGLHVRAENQIRVALPDLQLVFLGSIDGAADDLKDVGWSAVAAVLGTDENTDDMRGPKFAGSTRWNRRDQAAIGEATGSDLNGFEQAGKSAARTNRF